VATLHGVHKEALEKAKSTKVRNVALRPTGKKNDSAVPTGCVSEDRFGSCVTNALSEYDGAELYER
jgi:hypothetical protein